MKSKRGQFWQQQLHQLLAHSRGKNPFHPNVTTITVIKSLSDAGSATLPKTVNLFHLLANHPSNRSVHAATNKRPTAGVSRSVTIR